jgi:hypothetical protein
MQTEYDIFLYICVGLRTQTAPFANRIIDARRKQRRLQTGSLMPDANSAVCKQDH